MEWSKAIQTGYISARHYLLGATAAALLMVPAPASADFHDGLTAYERRDFRAAWQELQPLANQGDPRAQRLLGRMFLDGHGVVQNYVQAHKWLNLAAAGEGDAAAVRDKAAALMSSDQIAEAQRLAAAWRPDAPEPVAAAPTRPFDAAEITDLQWQLALHGYDPGPADGVAGWRTAQAIRAYQADAALPVDGRPSPDLLEHLRFHVPAVRNDRRGDEKPAAILETAPQTPLLAPDDPNRAFIVGIQEELATRGYGIGLADGIPGPRTRAAIRRYQASNGLPVDGEASLALLNHLRFVSVGIAAVQ